MSNAHLEGWASRMFTLKKENPFASPEPFHDEVNLHDDAERGFGASSRSQDVPSALGVGNNAWGGSGVNLIPDEELRRCRRNRNNRLQEKTAPEGHVHADT